MDNPPKPKAPTPDTIVDTMVQIESGIAPAIYWVLTALAVVVLIFGALIVVSLRQDGDPWGVIATAGVAVAGGAALVYVVGWTWRWVFTRRTDHFFAKARYSSDTKEPARQKWARILEVGSWF